MNKTNSTHIEASIVVPDLDAGYSEVRRALGVPDDEVELDGRVERACPHVTLLGRLSIREKRPKQSATLEPRNNPQRLQEVPETPLEMR